MAERAIRGGVGQQVPHESATLHVSGTARYIDDLPEPRGTLHAALGQSERAHATIVALDLSAVRAAQGVVAVVTAADIPGTNNFGAKVHDDPIFAAGEVEHVGQALFAVAATEVRSARRAARMAQVQYRDLPAALTADAALAEGSLLMPSAQLQRGDSQAGLRAATHHLSGRVHVGGQEHFYLEGQIALAVPQEGGDMIVYSSTQHPGEVQLAVAHALGKQAKDVIVECRRMGGAFGGKESQPAQFACIAAVLAARTGHPVKLRLDRDVDMTLTGKRHDFAIDYEVGFADDGRIQGIEFTFASRCGMSSDLSGPVNDRALFHADNAYFLEHVRLTSHRCKTHTVSNTAFRGFGGPQGMFAIEYVIDEIARYLRVDPLVVRKVNLYGETARNVTHYQQTIEDNILHGLIESLAADSSYFERRASLARWNAESPVLKKGIALTPVKFGISFTATHLNQAGALVHVYTDGSVHLNHGGTEMGQGLFTKVAQVVAQELQIDVDQIKATAADTSKVPNASATAASAGADLNGMAAQAAARTIKTRLIRFASEHFGVPKGEVRFEDNQVHVGGDRIAFAALAQLAWAARISLSATGFYRTPKIFYDQPFTGRPFYYYAYGAAVSEVIIDSLTGEYRVLRVDILHDCGRSLNPALDLGQIEGGFIQGMGWLTTEALWWDGAGALKTHAPSTYKIPTCSDLPRDFRVKMLESAENRQETIHRSKAVGEPPLMLALSVFHAIKDAVANTGDGARSPHLNAPATPEAVLMAVEALRSQPMTAKETTKE